MSVSSMIIILMSFSLSRVFDRGVTPKDLNLNSDLNFFQSALLKLGMFEVKGTLTPLAIENAMGMWSELKLLIVAILDTNDNDLIRS